jgi:hypothetical protein
MRSSRAVTTSRRASSWSANPFRNLAKAIRELPHVLVFDNSDLGRPFRNVARFQSGCSSP